MYCNGVSVDTRNQVQLQLHHQIRNNMIFEKKRNCILDFNIETDSGAGGASTDKAHENPPMLIKIKDK